MPPGRSSASPRQARRSCRGCPGRAPDEEVHLVHLAVLDRRELPPDGVVDELLGDRLRGRRPESERLDEDDVGIDAQQLLDREARELPVDAAGEVQAVVRCAPQRIDGRGAERVGPDVHVGAEDDHDGPPGGDPRHVLLKPGLEGGRCGRGLLLHAEEAPDLRDVREHPVDADGVDDEERRDAAEGRAQGVVDGVEPDDDVRPRLRDVLQARLEERAADGPDLALVGSPVVLVPVEQVVRGHRLDPEHEHRVDAEACEADDADGRRVQGDRLAGRVFDGAGRIRCRGRLSRGRRRGGGRGRRCRSRGRRRGGRGRRCRGRRCRRSGCCGRGRRRRGRCGALVAVPAARHGQRQCQGRHERKCHSSEHRQVLLV